ncbi:hypothetical protein A2721_03245 [Candidatus Gottesmanbacteria bacterium RIFCSPHIGHO2_01_FULL_47_48]|uniref:LytR/CpsA/Psr regulator C-terminal domain-containing protein n=1 Tax=Candidatus Gottesmanbacteria bacterium RIFCSPHIGHO2_01_FULL_47_48 TaxID=1798381 RepID=A0A1F6A565_9BACT|nr:MAG: hypothetical protein A2721_03245 [Candidatus Gottesmanbacteria bacterium RIFCSPHIGHO2_01_FULL_47_48]
MSIFGPPKAVIFLKRQSLDHFALSRGSFHLDFPKEIVSNSEILDRSKFLDLILKFLQGNKLLKQEIVLTLSPQVYFQKNFTSSADMPSQLADFYSAIPLDPTKMIKKEITDTKQTVALAFNREFPDALAEVAGQLGSKIIAVVPASLLLGTDQIEFLEVGDAKKVVQKIAQQPQYNLLTPDAAGRTNPQSSSPDDPKETKYPFPTRTLIILGFILLLLAATSVAAIKLNLLKIPESVSPDQKNAPSSPLGSKKSPDENPSSASSSAEASPSAESSAPSTPKSEVKIQVLNGTGTPSLAGKVKDELTKLGYSQIETGNAASPSAEATLVIFSENFPDPIKEEITTLLQKMFLTVESQPATPSASSKVTITTGKLTPSPE